MANVIIRASKDEVVYGVYNTTSCNFDCVNGTRKDILEYYLEDLRPDSNTYNDEKAKVEKSLDRADQLGSDSRIGRGHWTGDGLVINNNKKHGGDGFLPRKNIAEFMRILAREGNASHLIEELER